MNLTIDEIANFLDTWNSWYLISHDGYLKSESSENGVEIEINPIETDKIDAEVISDLREYTDHLDVSQKGRFKISFLFAAYEHQAEEILRSIRPVMEMAEYSSIEIKNSMEFIDKDTLKMAKAKAEAKNEKESDAPSPEPLLRHEVIMRGEIQKDSVVKMEEILFNGESFPKLDTFMEASRLYDTVKRNYDPPASMSDMHPFECKGEEEAGDVSKILGDCTDFRQRLVRGNVIETAAMPEELAAVVSYTRYEEEFDLFPNPYADFIRERRSADILAARQSLYRSCTMFMTILFMGMAVLLWFLMKKGK